MDIAHEHLRNLRRLLPDSLYQVYSGIYEKTLSFYGLQGLSDTCSTARAERAGLAAIRHKFNRFNYY